MSDLSWNKKGENWDSPKKCIHNETVIFETDNQGTRRFKRVFNFWYNLITISFLVAGLYLIIKSFT